MIRMLPMLLRAEKISAEQSFRKSQAIAKPILFFHGLIKRKPGFMIMDLELLALPGNLAQTPRHENADHDLPAFQFCIP